MRSTHSSLVGLDRRSAPASCESSIVIQLTGSGFSQQFAVCLQVASAWHADVAKAIQEMNSELNPELNSVQRCSALCSFACAERICAAAAHTSVHSALPSPHFRCVIHHELSAACALNVAMHVAD